MSYYPTTTKSMQLRPSSEGCHFEFKYILVIYLAVEEFVSLEKPLHSIWDQVMSVLS